MSVRKIPKNYRNVTGIAAHNKSIGSATFESTLERDFLSLLEFSKDVTQFEIQPISIEWLDLSGKKHNYVPDVLVHYKQFQHTKDVILYEVKYRIDLKENWQILKPKFKAAVAYCKARGWRFKLITEVEIRTVYLDNVRFLLPYVNRGIVHEHYEAHMELLDDKIRSFKTSTPNDLLTAIFDDEWRRAELLPALWYLIGTFQIGVDLNQPLSMHSKIWSII